MAPAPRREEPGPYSFGGVPVGIMVKVSGRTDVVTIDGDSVTYAEGGTILEVLDSREELLAAFRNWEYAILQDVGDDDDEDGDLEDDEDLEEDGDLDDEELDDLDDDDLEEVTVTGPPSVDEEEAVQRAREVMTRAIAEAGGLPIVNLALEDGAPTN